MELKERTFVERSGIIEVISGYQNALYVVYVETNGKKTVRIMDAPPPIGLAIDFPALQLLPFIQALVEVYNETNQSPLVSFMVRREEN